MSFGPIKYYKKSSKLESKQLIVKLMNSLTYATIVDNFMTKKSVYVKTFGWPLVTVARDGT